MSYNKIDKRISEHTEKLGGEFLFKTEEISNDALEQKTRIISKESMNCLTYYGILKNYYGSNQAIKIKTMLENLFIGFNGLGRSEAVQVLEQNFPKKIEVEKGHDETEV